MAAPEPRPGSSPSPTRIVPLQDLGARELEPLLAHEHVCWSQRLGWDFRDAASTLPRLAANGTILGFAQRSGSAVVAYAYFVAKVERSHIGGAHALPSRACAAPPRPLLLIERGIEHLKRNVGTARIECQFFYFAEEPLDALLHGHGFRAFPRRFLRSASGDLLGRLGSAAGAAGAIRAWRRSDRQNAARVIHDGFVGGVDAVMSACYDSVDGCETFFDGVTERGGCGEFDADASAVAILDGDIAGVILASRISPSIGHIVQLSIAPRAQRRGLGRRLLRSAAVSFATRGVSSITLAVSADNRPAHDWYLGLGFTPVHDFHAWAWHA